MGWNRHVVAACALVVAHGCGTGDTRIDPGDLELRDLLGVSPETAGRWDTEQRASALRVLDEALAESGEPIAIDLLGGDTVDTQVARSLGELDARRFADGDSALGLVHVTVTGEQLVGATRRAPTLRAFAEGASIAPRRRLELSETWQALPPMSHDVLSALASDAGASEADTVVIVPAPRLTAIASYVATTPPRMLVNPVLLAAIDPGAATLTETAAAAAGANVAQRGDRERRVDTPGVLANNGNPYSFYGSVAECAFAQRTRCTACVAANDCLPVTSTSDGVAECAALDADGGRGYHLLCANLAVAITSVEQCTADLRPGCAMDVDAASDLNQLANNVVFLDDSQCASGLDACLAKIYGEPGEDYPGPGIDGGVDPVNPPRETDVTCNDSCDGDKSSNCEFSPNCSCDGPSCGNSFSCDSSCSSSNNQSGCNDNCDSCDSSDSGGSSGGGCGGDDSSGGSSGGGCGESGDSGGGCGGNCGGDGSSCGGSSGGGSSGGGSCGGDSCGGDSGGCGGDSGGCGGDSGGCGGGGGGDSSCGGGGGGGGGCQVAKKPPSAVFAVAMSLSWALLPLPLAVFMRRRAKRKTRTAASDESASEEVQS